MPGLIGVEGGGGVTRRFLDEIAEADQIVQKLADLQEQIVVPPGVAVSFFVAFLHLSLGGVTMTFHPACAKKEKHQGEEAPAQALTQSARGIPNSAGLPVSVASA